MKIMVRYGVGKAAACFVLLWCSLWVAFIVYALVQGQFNWGEGEARSMVVSRVDTPGWYWSILGFTLAMVIGVAALVLEVERSPSDSDSAK